MCEVKEASELTLLLSPVAFFILDLVQIHVCINTSEAHLVQAQILPRLEFEVRDQEVRQILIKLDDGCILWVVSTEYPTATDPSTSGRPGRLGPDGFGREGFRPFDLCIEFVASIPLCKAIQNNLHPQLLSKEE
jgi:hypothetical protein